MTTTRLRVLEEFDSEQGARNCATRLEQAGVAAVVRWRVIDPGLPGIVSIATAVWAVEVDANVVAAARTLLRQAEGPGGANEQR